MRKFSLSLVGLLTAFSAGPLWAQGSSPYQTSTPYVSYQPAAPVAPMAPMPMAPAGPATPMAEVLPPPVMPGTVVPGPEVQYPPAAACPCACDSKKLYSCHINWLQPWTCDDLKMEPVEPKAKYCGCKGLFWCPKEEEECKDCEKKEENGNGEKKEENGNGEKKEGNGSGEKKEGNGTNGAGSGDDEKKEAAKDEKTGEAEEEAEEEEGPDAPLMQWMQCRFPKKYCRMEKRGDNFYGWLQMGYTANFDSPRDRTNFGTGYNWRSNDFQLNQFWLTYENTLEQDDTVNFGYRVDAMIGTDAPFNVQLGLFDQVVGTGQVNRVGFDLPQFYVEGHIPNVCGTKGIDIKVGKWFTLVNYEVIPATGNFFYSHSYTFFFGPFNNTGVLTTTHLTDTVDVYAGIFRGWEKFEDNNDRVSYTGAVSWKSCDERISWFTAMQTGPEQDNDNGNYRTTVSSFLTMNFGACNQWSWVVGGNFGIDSNAVTNDAGVRRNANWYSNSTYLFYTIDPRLKLGLRGEYFRDEDGYRTGFAGTFYEITMGLNYLPYKNLRIRPELRFDWSPNSQPYNDQTDGQQTTAAVDVIWTF